jgi:hypothetical protein
VRADRRVERRLLVRILAVAKLLAELHRERQRLGKELPLVGEGEPLGDHRIIDRRRRKSLGRQILAEIE